MKAAMNRDDPYYSQIKIVPQEDLELQKSVFKGAGMTHVDDQYALDAPKARIGPRGTRQDMVWAVLGREALQPTVWGNMVRPNFG